MPAVGEHGWEAEPEEIEDDDLEPSDWITLCARRAFDGRQAVRGLAVGSAERLDGLLTALLDAVLGASELLTKVNDHLDDWAAERAWPSDKPRPTATPSPRTTPVDQP